MVGDITDLGVRQILFDIIFWFEIFQLARFKNLSAVQTLDKLSVLVPGNDLGASMGAWFRHAILFSGSIPQASARLPETGKPEGSPPGGGPEGWVLRACITAVIDTFRTRLLRLFLRFLRGLSSGSKGSDE